MAVLFPSKEEILITKPSPTEGELFLINKLEEFLDNSYEIYFQPLLNGDKPDIVILRKNGGILIIEVKDWELSNYRIDNKGNFSLIKNNAYIKSPIHQALRYKKNICELHMPMLEDASIIKKGIKNVVQIAVYFHKENSSSLRYLRNVSNISSNIMGRDNITKSGIDALMRNTRINGSSIYFNEELYIESKRMLQPSFQLYEDRINISLDEYQMECAKSKVGNYKIKGVAGSGKTIVLAERATNCYKRTNGRILILTYNITLKNYIEERIGLALQKNNIDRMIRKEFVITNYHQFINSMANNHSIKMNLKSYDNIGLFNGIDLSYDKFDGIFIDEVQDFKYEWLKIIKENFLKKNGEYLLVGDEKQNIYDRELDKENKCKTNIPGTWKTLKKCYRLKEKIAIVAQKFQSEFLSKKYSSDEFEMVYQPNLFSNSHIKYKKVNEDNDYTKIVDDIIEYVKNNSLNNNDIAIISPRVESVRQIEEVLRKKYKILSTIMHETEEQYQDIIDKNNEDAAGKKLISIRRAKKCNFRMNDGKIKLSTIKSFKGWEIHTLFLLYDESCEEENMYVSITRAISSLYVINLGTDRYDNFFKNITEGFE